MFCALLIKAFFKLNLEFIYYNLVNTIFLVDKHQKTNIISITNLKWIVTVSIYLWLQHNYNYMNIIYIYIVLKTIEQI